MTSAPFRLRPGSAQRVGVLAVGLERANLLDSRAAVTLLHHIAPTQCFAVFQAGLPSVSAVFPDVSHLCTDIQLKRARELLSGGARESAEVRMITPAELSWASNACLGSGGASEPSGSGLYRSAQLNGSEQLRQCPSSTLQSYKVQLAFKMLTRAENRTGTRFDVVMRIRFDMALHVNARLLAQVAEAGSVASGLALQGDFAWIASRNIADVVAGAWNTIAYRFKLWHPFLSSQAVLRALALVDWARLSRSCWAFHSNFLRYMPYPQEWSEGWSRVRVIRVARNASYLLAAMSSTSVIWENAHPTCGHQRAPPAPALQLERGRWIEHEAALGLAVYAATRSAMSSEGDNCTSFGTYSRALKAILLAAAELRCKANCTQIQTAQLVSRAPHQKQLVQIQ